jgi:hypothetical protein
MLKPSKYGFYFTREDIELLTQLFKDSAALQRVADSMPKGFNWDNVTPGLYSCIRELLG